MKAEDPRPVSDLVCWVILGMTFPLSSLLLEPLRRDTLKGLEEMLGDRPLPAVTVFCAWLPEQLLLPSTVLGVFVLACGIMSGRIPWCRRHRVLVITFGWMFSFLLLFVLFAGLFAPYLTVTYGMWWDLQQLVE